MKEQYFTPESYERVTDEIIGSVIAVVPKQKKKEWRDSRAALLVLDVQDFFTHESSHAFVPSSTTIIPNINKLIRHFSDSGNLVIFTRHFNDPENAFNMGSWWGDLLQKPGKYFGIDESIEPAADHVIIDKSQYDAFHNTDLEQIMRDRSVERVVICGVMTNLCCETTARSAFVKGFGVWMPVDATATYNRELHTAAFTGLSFGILPISKTKDIAGR